MSNFDAIKLSDALVMVRESLLNQVDEDSMDIVESANGFRVTFFNDSDFNASSCVKIIVTGLDDFKNKVGVHRFPEEDGFDATLVHDVEYHLGEALHSHWRDGFETIYIHMNLRG